MRRHDIIPYILYMLFAVCSVSAYGQFNPDNPEEPQVPVFRYRITTSCSTQNVAWTSGDGEWAPGDQVWIHTSSYNGQYTFSHWTWTIDGKEYTNSSEGFYFTMKEQAVSFVAHYKFTPPES